MSHQIYRKVELYSLHGEKVIRNHRRVFRLLCGVWAIILLVFVIPILFGLQLCLAALGYLYRNRKYD